MNARSWIIEWLPRYAPELNDTELSWRDLKRHYFAQRTFRDVADLDATTHGRRRSQPQTPAQPPA